MVLSESDGWLEYLPDEESIHLRHFYPQMRSLKSVKLDLQYNAELYCPQVVISDMTVPLEHSVGQIARGKPKPKPNKNTSEVSYWSAGEMVRWLGAVATLLEPRSSSHIVEHSYF